MTQRANPPRARPAAGPPSGRRLAAFAIVFALLAQQAVWRTGDLVAAVALRRPWGGAAFTIALHAVLLLAVGFSWWRLRPDRAAKRRLAAAMGVTLAVGFVVAQALVALFLPVASFHGFFTWRLRSLTETSSSRPRVTYALSSLGFRGAEWGAREPGVTRIAVVGDSFVFGSGVEAGDTIDRALAERLAQAAPERRFEVLNLGVTGDNIASHVRLARIAVEHLDADAVVIGLHAPNDLSRIEPPEELADLVRPSPFGVAMYLFGASWVRLAKDLASLDGEESEEGLAWLDAQVGELARVRAGHPAASILVFCYGPQDDPRVRAVIARHPEVRLVPGTPAFDDEHNYIEGDGHPNAQGNRAFAADLAPFLLEMPRPAPGARDLRPNATGR